jgi:hypothetical protein
MIRQIELMFDYAVASSCITHVDVGVRDTLAR